MKVRQHKTKLHYYLIHTFLIHRENLKMMSVWFLFMSF